MKIAIVHHHFDPGGVTSVVLAHLNGLTQLAPSLRPSQVLLLHGGRSSAIDLAVVRTQFPSLTVKLTEIPQLEYDQPLGETATSQSETRAPDSCLAEAIEVALRDSNFDSNETILHVHNPTLGKCVSLPPALRKLAANGWALLLQIHDFAEDLRPRNLASLFQASRAQDLSGLTNWLYPSGEAVHYATLSTRDAGLLRKRIVPESRLHVVPNPIVANVGTLPDRESSRREIDRHLGIDPASQYMLYPVRGIQRKNVGEVLLLSLMLGPSVTFSVTLPPTTPIEKASWLRWQRWARELKLPLIFGSGLHPEITLQQNRAAADRILSTSVAEGFGLVFLESWLMERSVVGRDLPGVTDDFREAGVVLDGLYDRIRLPLSRGEKLAALADNEKAYRLTWNALPESLRSACRWDKRLKKSQTEVDHLDFAQLTPRWQGKVLYKMANEPGFINACRALNGALLESFDAPSDGQLISDNRRQVANQYSPKKIAEGLVSVYQSLLQQPRLMDSYGSGRGSVFEQFSALAPFHPLRTETPIEDDPFSRLAKPLRPLPNDESPILKPLPDIRAVVFDVYGTLVISGSGDVGTADRSPRSQALDEALDEALETLGIEIDDSADAAIERLHRIVQQHQQVARDRGVQYPEVDILRVWRQWLDETLPQWQSMEGCSFKNSSHKVNRMLHVRLAEEFEARANPCHTMPEAARLIRKLSDHGLMLGIVSNAQFFTQSMFQAAVQDDWYRMGFDRDLCFFSYRFGHGKPGLTMYEKLVASLARRGIAASQALFVGNDMLNDIAAAASCGFRTALFAGDQRSLRWRTSDPRVSVQPDVIVTELTQLLHAVQLA